MPGAAGQGEKNFQIDNMQKRPEWFFLAIILQAATVRPATGLVQLRKPWNQPTEVVVNGSG